MYGCVASRGHLLSAKLLSSEASRLLDTPETSTRSEDHRRPKPGSGLRFAEMVEKSQGFRRFHHGLQEGREFRLKYRGIK